MARKHYQNPPITEAVIDLQTSLPETTTVSDIEPLCKSERDSYPTREQISTTHGEFQVKFLPDRSPEGNSSITTDPLGFRLWSTDKKQVFQARLDGFSFSRLAPYSCWEEFVEEALRLWGKYLTHMEPNVLRRVAVRYINRIEIPTPILDFESYFRTFATLSPEINKEIRGAFIRLQIPYENPDALLNLTFATIDQDRPDRLPILLDIDLFQSGSFNPDHDSVLKQLELLHNCENDIFEACITDQTRELFG